MCLLILLWQLTVNQQPFYLDADLKRARYVLRDEHGIWLTKEDKPYTLKVFEQYAKMNLAKFNFSSKRVGKYNISAWKLKGKPKLEIYHVETKLHVDTAVTIHTDQDSISKQYIQKIPISVDFSYRTYIIHDANKPQLVFTIATKGEQLNYSIGGHSVEPLYESAPVGLQKPDEKEILRIISKN